MKIGEFWGISAPMLCVLLQRSDAVNKLYESAPAYLSEDSFNSIHSEFSWLYHSVLSLCEYAAPAGAEEFNISDATASNHTLSSDEVANWKRVFTVKAALQIIAGEQKGLLYNLASQNVAAIRTELMDYVTAWFNEHEFTAMETQAQVRKMVKALQTQSLSSEKSQLLAAAFGLTLTVVDTVGTEKGKHVLTQEEKQVILYFAERLEFIAEAYHRFSLFKKMDTKVFGVSALELLKRKPAALRYAVANRFQHLQERASRITLENTISYTKQEIERYKQFLQKSVESEDVAFNEILTPESLKVLLSSESPECAEYFTYLFSRQILNYSDYLQEDIQLLIATFNVIRELTPEGLCKEFKIAAETDLQKLSLDLCSIGIVGINLDSIWLFTDAMRNIPVMSSIRLRQSSEKISEIKSTILDIEAFLETLIPIGEGLAV